METVVDCVAGHGHVHHMSFVYIKHRLSGCTLVTPDGIEDIIANEWFDTHLHSVVTTRHHLPKGVDVLPYLSHLAGTTAVDAMRDYDVGRLALAFAYSYSWQLINGAKILPGYGELAKTYAGIHAVYLFRTAAERQHALDMLSGK